MQKKIANMLAVLILVSGLLASTSFAATVRASGSVTPSIVAPGATVFIHSAVQNLTTTNQAVTVALTVKDPGTCTSAIAPHTGAFAFNLRSSETRLAALSLDVPPSACSGTYSVTITVTNSAGVVLATHTATFTVEIATP